MRIRIKAVIRQQKKSGSEPRMRIFDTRTTLDGLLAL